MKNLNRRDLCVALSALAAMGSVAAGAQAPVMPGRPGEKVLSESAAFAFDKLPVKASANGGASRAVTEGVLTTGEFIEMHETTLPPGKMPHPAHKHRHSEFLMIREGTVEFESEGTKRRLGPGGVAFAASNKMHGLTNVGDVPAQYFVIAIGRPSALQQV